MTFRGSRKRATAQHRAQLARRLADALDAGVPYADVAQAAAIRGLGDEDAPARVRRDATDGTTPATPPRQLTPLHPDDAAVIGLARAVKEGTMKRARNRLTDLRKGPVDPPYSVDPLLALNVRSADQALAVLDRAEAGHRTLTPDEFRVVRSAEEACTRILALVSVVEPPALAEAPRKTPRDLRTARTPLFWMAFPSYRHRRGF